MISYEEPVSMAFNDIYHQSTAWCLDSGCTSHMCRDKNLFTEFNPRENATIQLAVDKTAKITGIGTVLITVPNSSGTTNLTLKNVLCVPELKCNLISTSKATTNNRSVLFKERYAKIIEPNGCILVQAVRQGDLYYVWAHEGPFPWGIAIFCYFFDDKSRYIEVSFLKTKDEIKNAFVKYVQSSSRKPTRK